MTTRRIDHYAEAERLLARRYDGFGFYKPDGSGGPTDEDVARAQAHAMLALTAAIRQQIAAAKPPRAPRRPAPETSP